MRETIKDCWRPVVLFLLMGLASACRPEPPLTLAAIAPTPHLGQSTVSSDLPATWTPVPALERATLAPADLISTRRFTKTPWPTATATPTRPTATNTSTPTRTPTLFLSITPPPTAAPFPPVPMVASHPADFNAIRAELRASGRDLAFAKIGFHVGIGGNQAGLGDWMRQLDAAGVPFFLKSVGHAGPIYEAQQLARASGVPHTLVFRSMGDVPDYNLPPEEAALEHWQKHMDLFPPELDRSLVWLETVNEIDHNRAEWLAQFSITTAQLALADGFRWAAFSWSMGEPEWIDWQSPAMLFFLRMVGQHPHHLAIALHEYSGVLDDITFESPGRVGRFLRLFQLCDLQGIPRPTVLITEWGWSYNRVPPVNQAMGHIEWASALYAPFPQVKGVAIWYLGEGYGGIADSAQKLIVPLTEYSLTHYFAVPLFPSQPSADPYIYLP